ncbi:bifunctional diaminohydroxyphosphoribosylaminopyrimidine deaminase/5-amino-6-(5-phosphoribosylamino)uracil reductase RibD [Candidatus Symbiobacter mobilis]|uniref:Riboflavin biosynthesis protein RibD n=1 Tax=Candidatus Symbiobacter mobilis CR TaxID=946483 RepID=U5NAV5_9BURK|nr:bifunctional diaminohydroxyphosphoribosylaminopyrimidine deaminase/5-amino-6-(5-phosphoribosylamino)uracil reductase RibD [Candidatus Symbiobacter mobilis]AGX87353.1 diaminohydroxyphosphoribosylaminopyrimidine deaminase [Candidatus Symbiobacter mobilis CR]
MHDRPFLEQALQLAHNGLVLTAPNPRVGCVLTDPHGCVLGQGHTQRAGEPHAEIMALRDAATRGHDVHGATAYVTLEPCSHTGRTPPCCNALIAAGIRRVVATQQDPNPLVRGQGFAALRNAGVTVDVLPPEDALAQACRELNLGFFSRMLRGRPWVRMKCAASLDGKTALPDGQSRWITSAPARTDGHAWRARSCAVLTGVGTVLADDPLLDVRWIDTPRQPAIVIADSTLRTPPDAAVFRTARLRLVYTASHDAQRSAALQECGVTIVQMPNPQGQVDLAGMLGDLAQREVNELHVEAGARLCGALWQAGLVDEMVLYLAPKLLGQGRDLAHFGPLHDLGEAIALEFQDIERVGVDLRIVARVRGRELF